MLYIRYMLNQNVDGKEGEPTKNYLKTVVTEYVQKYSRSVGNLIFF